MERRIATALALILLGFLCVAVPAHSDEKEPDGSEDKSARDLASAANNPAAPLTLIQFRDVLAPSVPGASGAANLLEMQPVLPFKRNYIFPFAQLVKVTIPVASAPSSGGREQGMGDIQFFDLVAFTEPWGLWGFGPTLTFPTASSPLFGQGKWQAGPAVAVIYTSTKNLVIGAVLENSISYAGDSDRPAVNSLVITPTLTFVLKHGWFAGLSDFNFTFDWTDGGAATIPLGLQAGRVFKVDKHAFSASIEVGYVVARPSPDVPRWVIGFEFTPIFRRH